MLTGKGLGPWKKILMAKRDALDCYSKMITDKSFLNSIKYSDINPYKFSALLLPGGHASGMNDYLASETLQKVVVDFFIKQTGWCNLSRGAPCCTQHESCNW